MYQTKLNHLDGENSSQADVLSLSPTKRLPVITAILLASLMSVASIAPAESAEPSQTDKVTTTRNGDPLEDIKVCTGSGACPKVKKIVIQTGSSSESKGKHVAKALRLK